MLFKIYRELASVSPNRSGPPLPNSNSPELFGSLPLVGPGVEDVIESLNPSPTELPVTEKLFFRHSAVFRVGEQAVGSIDFRRVAL